MRVVLLAAVVTVALASVVKDESNNVLIGKDTLVNANTKQKEVIVVKLLNNILQPTVYEDIRQAAQEWQIEANTDLYQKPDVVKKFIALVKVGLLPRGEVFVHTNEQHIKEAIAVFRLLYSAKDFDVFIRTASWLRERINAGMFEYALTAAVFHRNDTRGIALPAPYEINPNFFIESNVINTAMMLKMAKGSNDPALANYLGIKSNDKNVHTIDARKGVRHVLSEDDRINYFTEDIDLNTYMYYLHMSYPYWLTDESDSVNKVRRGEIMLYAVQQLLARLRLERLSHQMCDIKMANWNEPVESGYWPNIRLPNGDEMPVRQNNVKMATDVNVKQQNLLNNIEQLIAEGILTGKIERPDGTVINIRKPEDIENLARLLLGGIGLVNDDAKAIHLTNLLKNIMYHNQYNVNKHTFVPTALNMYTTCLRDPLYWQLMKSVVNNAVLFKNLLPQYTRNDLDFPGVKIEDISTNKLVTYIDEYDVDITNAMYLDQAEVQKKQSDMLLVARKRRLNNQPFKITINVASDKSADAVVRVFLGPKYDCMGRLLDINDKRLDMVEIDTFLHKLETGKNTIVRNSNEMKGVIEDRPWARDIWSSVLNPAGTPSSSHDKGNAWTESYWHKSRNGFPKRLLMPLGTLGGLPLQLLVIITPVKTASLLPNIDVAVMKERHDCRWSTCIDTMPLGFPLDREIDQTQFFNSNMKLQDVSVFRKDMDLSNTNKAVDMSDLVMKRDDLTYLDNDMLVSHRYKKDLVTNINSGNQN